MNSIRFIYSLGLFLIAGSVGAQLRKVEISFEKGKYEQCVQYCKLAKPSSGKQEYDQIKVYQCQALLNLYKKSPTQISYLDQALLVYKTEKIGLKHTQEQLSSALLSVVQLTSDSLHKRGNKNLAKKYIAILANQFHDTSSLYTTYFPVAIKPTVQNKPVLKEKETVQRISRTSLVKYTEQFLNIPYKWAGEDSSGFDCSGLVIKTFRHFGYQMAHGAKDQSELGENVSRSQLKPGDLVFFGKRYDTGRCKIDHVAIVHEVSDTKLIVIHATSRGVNIQELKTDDYWGKKILFYKNLIDHFTVSKTARL